MADPATKPVVKRDASGRTMDQRSVKIASAIKQGNTAYSLSQMKANPPPKPGKGSGKGR